MNANNTQSETQNMHEIKDSANSDAFSTAKRALEVSDNLPSAKTPKLNQHESPRILRLVDFKLSKVTAMFDKLYAKCDTTEQILKKLDGKMSEVSGEINALNSRVAILEKSVPAMNALKNEVDIVKPEVKELKTYVSSLSARVQALENIAVASDLRLHGVPIQKDENLMLIFQTICKSINIAPPAVRKIYRMPASTGAKTNSTGAKTNTDPAIIIKLFSPDDRMLIIKSVALFKKSSKGLLLLRHAGFDSNQPIYFNECLSKANHRILTAAIRYKKQKKLSAVFSMRGNVFVKKIDDTEALKITSAQMLDEICLAVRVCNNNSSSDLFRGQLETENA